MNINANFLTKILANSIQEHTKIMRHNQVGFIIEVQGWLNICKSVNTNKHIKKFKKKKTCNQEMQSSFNKVSYTFMVKVLGLLGTESHTFKW